MEELKVHTDELCTILTAEKGRPYSMAQWEITWIFETYVPALLKMELPDSTWNETGVGQITKRYVPLGVVAAISPWESSVLAVIHNGVAISAGWQHRCPEACGLYPSYGASSCRLHS
jgi:acyl-CoA reductase-like NAD-dependent aldehyde dehydrogenase